MRRARIYKPTKSAMQSGKGNTKHWRLEYYPTDSTFIEPVMGWTASKDTYNSEFNLDFSSQDEAISYAKRNNIDFDLIEPKTSKLKLQTYTDIFKK